MASTRVYEGRVKKWAIGTGAVGIPLGLILFMFLSANGYVVITGFSGDTTCAGIAEEPCYAYINFTPVIDVFIYPTSDPTWVFNAEPTVKSLRMYRSWGSGWREINMSKKCNGTWCGKSPTDKRKEAEFVVAFRTGREYQIRFVAEKFKITDTIKWGFGTIDPLWNGYSEDDFFVELIDNKADLTFGEATFKITNPSTFNITTDLEILLDNMAGASEITSMEYFEQITTSRNITDYITVKNNRTCTREVVNNVTKVRSNETYDCSTYSKVENGSHFIDVVSYDTTSTKITLIVNESRIFKIKANWKAKTGLNSREWFPEINVSGTTLRQNKWAWWNTSWAYKRALNITNSNPTVDATPNMTINLTINLTDFIDNGKMNETLNDTRILFQDSIELDRYIIPSQGLHLDTFESLDYGDNFLNSIPEGTVEVWAYFPDIRSTSQYLVWKNQAGSLDGDFGLLTEEASSQDKIKCFLETDAGATSLRTDITTEAWHHIACHWNSSGVYLFLDGNLSVEDTTVTVGLLNNAKPMIIGDSEDLNEGTSAIIDELRISNIGRYNNGNFTPNRTYFKPDDNTVALWHFDGDWNYTNSTITDDIRLTPTVNNHPHFTEGYIVPKYNGNNSILFQLNSTIVASASDNVNYSIYYGYSQAGSPKNNRSEVFTYYTDFESDIYTTNSNLGTQDGWVSTQNPSKIFVVGGTQANINSYSGGQVIEFIDDGLDSNAYRGVEQGKNIKFVGYLRKNDTAVGGVNPRLELNEGLTAIVTMFADGAVPSLGWSDSDGAHGVAPFRMGVWYRYEVIINENGKFNITITNTTDNVIVNSSVDRTVQNAMTNGVDNITIRLNDQGGDGDQSYTDRFEYSKFLREISISMEAETGTSSVDITVVSPANITHTTTTSFDYNVTVTTPNVVDTVFYSIDGGQNFTLDNDTSTNFYNWSSAHPSVTNGVHKIVFFANESSGNATHVNHYFTVDVGQIDTNLTAWNGTLFTDPYVYFPEYFCNLNESNCTSSLYNASRGDFRIFNNGTANGTNINLRLNESLIGSDFEFLCGNQSNLSAESFFQINLTNEYLSVHNGTVAINESVDIWCWLNVGAAPKDETFIEILANITK